VPPRKIIITGTGVVTSAGVTSVNCTSTAIDGQAELSTWPTNCLPTTGKLPIVPRALSATVHVTFGTFGGIRPTTSRSKSSTISLRRSGHIAAAVTLRPSFNVSASGRSGKGLASASS
jgi:hypothetical protein